MYNRLLSFINASQILANNQYGLRESHSTIIVLLNFVDQVTSELDNTNFSLDIYRSISVFRYLIS